MAPAPARPGRPPWPGRPVGPTVGRRAAVSRRAPGRSGRSAGPPAFDGVSPPLSPLPLASRDHGVLQVPGRGDPGREHPEAGAGGAGQERAASDGGAAYSPQVTAAPRRRARPGRRHGARACSRGPGDHQGHTRGRDRGRHREHSGQIPVGAVSGGYGGVRRPHPGAGGDRRARDRGGPGCRAPESRQPASQRGEGDRARRRPQTDGRHEPPLIGEAGLDTGSMFTKRSGRPRSWARAAADEGASTAGRPWQEPNPARGTRGCRPYP